jgi:hypothetical protein
MNRKDEATARIEILGDRDLFAEGRQLQWYLFLDRQVDGQGWPVVAQAATIRSRGTATIEVSPSIMDCASPSQRDRLIPNRPFSRPSPTRSPLARHRCSHRRQ